MTLNERRETMLYLYLISQGKNQGDVTYDSAIVVAESESEARLIHPDGRAEWDGKDEKYGEWADSENVIVTKVGVSDIKLKGVLLASYNDG
jgi:hypothetical protein